MSILNKDANRPSEIEKMKKSGNVTARQHECKTNPASARTEKYVRRDAGRMRTDTHPPRARVRGVDRDGRMIAQKRERFRLLAQVPSTRSFSRQRDRRMSRALSLSAAVFVLLLSETFAAGEEQTTGAASNYAGEAHPSGPIGHKASGRLGPTSKFIVLGSLGLTALALLGHLLQVRADGKTSRGGGGGGATAVSGMVPNNAEMSELPLGQDSKRAGGLRRRSQHAVEGNEGSKPASLPLHKLIEAGDTKAVHSFVSHNSPELVQELFNMGDPALNGTTPLLLALRLGKDDIATLLLDGGADPNQPGAWGLTPLMYGAVYDRKKTVAAILSKGGAAIDLDAMDVHGNSAMSHAEGSGSSEVARLLGEHSAEFATKDS